MSSERAESAGSEALVELEGIHKYFGSVTALQGVSFKVRPGEVVGLVGDNGAGKSSLIKIITGYFPPTRGTIKFAGREVHFSSPAHARQLGIETVYQDLALVDELSIWRNFFLGKELAASPYSLRSLKISDMKRICMEQMRLIGLTNVRSADEPAGKLSGGERQSLAIGRSEYFGARVLLLDEPTAALSVKETQHVLNSIEATRKKGLGIVVIDHNMMHVQPISDRVVILEHGKVIAEVKKGEATIEELNAFLTSGVSRASAES